MTSTVFSGVVPYAYDNYGQAYILVGREALGRDSGKWSGFAGAYEPTERENAVQVAARECFEELMGLLGSKETLVDMIQHSATPVAVENGTQFLLPIQYVPFLPHMFDGVRHMYRDIISDPGQYTPFVEKDLIMWIALRPGRTARDSRLSFRNGFYRDIPVFESIILKA